VLQFNHTSDLRPFTIREEPVFHRWTLSAGSVRLLRITQCLK
jgi:hypothetical protein